MTIRNLDSLFKPRSVALIGASPQPATVGAVVAANLRSGGYQGAIYLVNPKHAAIEGTTVYPSGRRPPERRRMTTQSP